MRTHHPFPVSPDVLALARDLRQDLASTPLPRLAERARTSLGPEKGPTALTLARLWRKHREKFPTWEEFIGDSEAFSQASGERPARWRAARFAGCGTILDLCCGSGADSIALSAVTGRLIAVDHDFSRLVWARENVRRYGKVARADFVAADVEGHLPDADAAALDPDRRTGAGRKFAGRAVRPRHYAPPPDVWNRIRARIPHLAVKAAPGIPYSDIPSDSVPEFLQDRGECREAILWFGDLKPSSRTATVLSGGVGEAVTGKSVSADEPEELAVDGVGSVVYDPGPATVRAHLVTHLAARLGGWRLDRDIAYLSGDEPVLTPFATAFRVEDVWPFHLKRVKAALSARKIGALEIRTRRFPMRPDEVRRQLRLSGDRSATLILTKISDRPTAIFCERIAG